jgi:hypothetical protein
MFLFYFQGEHYVIEQTMQTPRYGFPFEVQSRMRSKAYCKSESSVILAQYKVSTEVLQAYKVNLNKLFIAWLSEVRCTQ